MAGNVAQLKEQLRPDNLAGQIYMMWNDFYNQRKPWVEEQKELRTGQHNEGPTEGSC